MSSDKLDKKVKSSSGIDNAIDSDSKADTDSENKINDTVNNRDTSIYSDEKVNTNNQLDNENKVKDDSLFANMKLSNPIKGKSFGSIVDFASIGLLFVSSIFVGATMGYFLDLKFGTKPYLSLIFLILGIIAGVKSVYKILRKTGMMNGQK